MSEHLFDLFRLELLADLAPEYLDKWSKLIKTLRRYKFLPLLIVSLIILWVPLNRAFTAVFIPVVQTIPDNSWLIQISLILCVLILYGLNLNRILNETTLIGNRRLLILYFLGVHVTARLSGLYYFYGLNHCSLCYLDLCYLLILVIEVVLFLITIRRKKIDSDVAYKGFIPDQPVDGDSLDRERCAKAILKEVQSTYGRGGLSDGALSVLLNEKFGAGKSSFLVMLKKQAIDENIVCLEYLPGLSNGRNDIIESLFSVLGNHIRLSGDFHLSFLLSSYSEIVSGKPAEGILQYLVKIFVRKTPVDVLYSEIRDSLSEIKSPIIILIDDVDRLDNVELMSLLRLLRDTANFPNLVYIVAADKDHMTDLLSRSEIKSPETYIKKFFNFEFLFPALDGDIKKKLKDELKNILDFYSEITCDKDSVIKDISENPYLDMVFDNFRDIYRFVNLLTFNFDFLKQNGLLNDINIVDFINISLLQYSDSYTYRILRDRHPVILELDDPMIGHLKIRPELKITDMYTEQLIKNIVANRKDQKTLEQEEEDKDTAEYVKDIHVIADKVLPTRFDVTAWLLEHMFTDSNRDKRSICFINEYFKYFSGKYREGEYNDDEITYIIQSDNEKFNEKIETIISSGKDDFFAHKIAVYIQKKDFDRINLLEKVMLFFNAYYEEKSKTRFPKSKSFYWEHSYISILVHLMFQSRKRGQKLSAQEINEVETFFNSQTDYAVTALVLDKIYISDEYPELIKTDKLQEWQRELIDRFFNSSLVRKPMDFTLLDTIICMDSMKQPYWNEALSRYLEKTQSSKIEQWVDFLVEKSSENQAFVKKSIRPYFSSINVPEWICTVVGKSKENKIDKVAFFD